MLLRAAQLDVFVQSLSRDLPFERRLKRPIADAQTLEGLTGIAKQPTSIDQHIHPGFSTSRPTQAMRRKRPAGGR